MPQDFIQVINKKNFAKTGYRSRNVLKAWMWLILGMLLGLSITAFVFVKQHHNRLKHHSRAAHLKVTHLAKSSGKKSKVLKKNNKHKEPTFDFYTVLPSDHEAITGPTSIKTEKEMRADYK